MIEEEKFNIVAPCQLMLELGETVYLTEGSKFNFKITRQDDLEIFEALIKNRNYQRSLSGYQPTLTKRPY